MKKPVVQVAAAIIENDRGEILLAQRAEPEALRGLWEFPGGKVEDGESLHEALIREITEELALEIRIRTFLGEFPYSYSGGTIHIQAFVASAQGNEFKIIEHLDVRWVRAEKIKDYPLAPADEPVLQAYLKLN